MVPGPAGGTVGFGVVGRGVGLVVGVLVGRVVGRDVVGRVVVGRVDGVRVGVGVALLGVGVTRGLVGVERGVGVALVGVTVGMPVGVGVASSPGAVGSEPLALSGSLVGPSVDTTSGPS